MWLSRHPIFLSAAKAWRSSLKRVARSKSSSAMMPANGCLGTIQISRWSVILPVSTKAPRAGEHAGSQARAGGFPATKGQRSPLPPRISPAKPWLDNRQIRIRQLPEKNSDHRHLPMAHASARQLSHWQCRREGSSGDRLSLARPSPLCAQGLTSWRFITSWSSNAHPREFTSGSRS
jgi:hypothetical protein